MNRFLSATLLLISLPFARQPDGAAQKSEIALVQPGAGAKATFEVRKIDSPILQRLSAAKLDTKQWQAMLAIRVHAGDKAADEKLPPVAGSYRVVKDSLSFEPSYSLRPGLKYHVTFDASKAPGGAVNAKPVTEDFEIPKVIPETPTVVEQVYPTTSTLPENQLKFYIHFTRAMSRGEAYQHIHLVAESGQEIPSAFLELGEELWDPDCKRFTLFFDPGRIKRGLVPREEAGTALHAGKSYTLVIDADWPDTEGNSLKAAFRKPFKVAAVEDAAIDTSTWQLTAPETRARSPIQVRFPRPLDHALLGRLLWITDADGTKVKGEISIGKEEKSWSFVPSSDWEPGNYFVVAGQELEDLAGNCIGRPFDVDLLDPATKNAKRETVKLPFAVK